ncbi:hypothetical protein KCP70_15495 [Salmonella enterica subsp. enterica]|nr:hypothetical protein KCP70_15495 [Salmonella enterica subsp. enterica]
MNRLGFCPSSWDTAKFVNGKEAAKAADIPCESPAPLRHLRILFRDIYRFCRYILIRALTAITAILVTAR